MCGSEQAASAAPITDGGPAGSIPPGAGSLPAGWSLKPAFPTVEPCPAPAPCGGLVFDVRAEYDTDAADGVQVIVKMYSSADAAIAGFAEAKKDLLDGEEPRTEIALPVAGADTSAGYTWQLRSQDGTEVSNSWAESAVLAGTAVIEIRMSKDPGEPSIAVLTALHTTIAARAREAQGGKTPTAPFVL
ncbi:hypothetical protein [Streptomyces sp. NPDC004266]|uniref:hypothetical protein n=1 Tax=Streptomyces sp. NPDC004266 TaxID=3364693 RepID=UPI0036C6FE7E